jgi:ribosomal protein S6
MEEAEKKTEEEEEEKEISSGVYEIGYLMIPTIAEENLALEVSDFKDWLADQGAVFISDEFPKLVELAYEMSRSINNKKQKFSYGYFGWVKFEVTPLQAQKIKKILDKNEKLIRYLLIKTVRGNTMSVKRSNHNRQEGNRRKDIPKEIKVVEKIDEENIDKEIEALVLE